MKDEDKTKKQLINELNKLRKRNAELEELDIQHKQAEETYKNLVEHSLQGLAIIQDGQVVFVNPAIVELSGYTMEELLSLSPQQVQSVIHPEDRERIWKNMIKRISGKQAPVQQEFRFLRKDGQVRWVKTISSLLEYKIRPAVQVAYVDITEQKQAEKEKEHALRELQIINDTIISASRMQDVDKICKLIGEKVHAVNQDSYIAVSLYDRELDAIRIRALVGFGEKTERIFDLLGFDTSEIAFHPGEMREETELYNTGKVEQVPGGLYVLLAGKVPPEGCKKIEDLLAIESVYTVGFALEDKPYGGISILLPKGKEVKYIYAIETLASYFSVMIHRIQAEEAQEKLIQDIEERYKEISLLYEVSKLSTEIYISIEDVMHKTTELIPPAWHYPEITCARIVLEGKEFNTENFQKTKWKQSSDIKVRGKSVGFIEVYYLKEMPELDEGPFLKEERDLINTVSRLLGEFIKRKRTEEEREKLQKELLQSQKMEAIGTLAGGVAHDFNNQLTAIGGYTDLAMLKVDESSPLYRNLKEIRNAATRAANLTRQLLLFSRKQPMEFKSLNINQTVNNLLKMLNRIIGEDITINTELQSDIWIVQGDVGNIEQIITNMVVNARDAMPEGGVVNIKTENLTLNEAECRIIPDAKPGKYVRLSIQDTGRGMDEETIERIFEPFFTTKKNGKGTGLGLSVVYGIVKEHQGWINVYSKPERGSIFKVYLPAEKKTMEEGAEEEISLQQLSGNGERILLVEDDEKVRQFAKDTLSENGYIVFEAADAKEALEIFQREEGNLNLVLSDIILPDEDGIQLIDKLISLKPELNVLLCSGYTDEKSQWQIIHQREFSFIQKPFGLVELLKAVKTALENCGHITVES